jgi:hypothetical protein
MQRVILIIIIFLCIQVTSSIPVEKCDLIPKKDCREISTLVPGDNFIAEIFNVLFQRNKLYVFLKRRNLFTYFVLALEEAEKCINVPKEICSKVSVPRKIKKTATKVFCPDFDIATGIFTISFSIIKWIF